MAAVLEIDKVMTPDLARTILDRTSDLRKRGMVIPVKMHPGATKGARDPHWGKGRMTDMRGNNLCIIPGHGHQKEELFPVDAVHLWPTRMRPEILEVISTVQQEYQHARQMLNAVPKEAKVNGNNGHGFHNGNGNGHVSALDPIMTDRLPEPSPAQSAPVDPSAFDKQFEEYKAALAAAAALKTRLAEQASTGGIERLRRLHHDRKEALAMVEAVEGDIIRLMTELSELGVGIPPELNINADVKLPADHVPEPRQRTPRSPREPGAPSNAWAPAKAKQYQPAIEQFCRKRGNAWLRGSEIMDAIGERVASPSTVLMPLVHDGFMERQGEKASTVYRWKM